LAAVPTANGLITRLAVADLQRHGIDPASLLSQAGLSSAALANRHRITATSQIDFLRLVSRALKDNWIGLTLAADFDLREWGMLYYAAASAHRLGDALQRLQRYVQIGNEAVTIRIEKGKLCHIGFSYTGVPRHPDRHQMEFFQYGCVRLCQQLVGRRVTPVAVSFVHHRSGDLREVHRMFGCPVEFDAAADQISFEAGLLDLALVSEDTFLSDVMSECCDEALAKRSLVAGPFRTLVENTIKPLLTYDEVRADVLAQRLAMSERTLARRLAAEGCSFAEVYDDLRRDLAVRYLEEPNLQVSKIAYLLGFHAPSAFSHACRRWTGRSPKELRRARLSGLVAVA
jgi:AraC-like DNA-binding protein